MVAGVSMNKEVEEPYFFIGEWSDAKENMYADLYEELIDLCIVHGAVLDLSEEGKIILIGTNSRFRKAFRKMYGHVPYSRVNGTIVIKSVSL